jgi:hypothetical protein
LGRNALIPLLFGLPNVRPDNANDKQYKRSQSYEVDKPGLDFTCRGDAQQAIAKSKQKESDGKYRKER